MIIARLLAGMVAIMSLSAVTPAFSNQDQAGSERDSRIIVEVSRGLENLSKEEIAASQNVVLSRIRSSVTSNFEFIQSYSVLNNAFVIDVNQNNIEAIKSLPGVASVTVDKAHARKAIGEGSTYSATITREKDPNRNISANTMGKPSDTNDGEGTVIAILDNEFFFRGTHTETTDCSFHDYECNGSPINHEVYADLDESVHVKFTFDNLTATLKKTNARRKSNKAPGEEGSLYFNKKVPFYFDYGGESTSYGKAGEKDFDVSSILTYHGSHVASIAAANAPTYKGIAPKAQLACMKVFTTYKADETAKNLGFGDSTGAYETCILSALEDCIQLGVDGINMSLGSDLDDFDSNSITLRTLSKLADGGIMTAISAGNSGKSSYSFTGGYGNWTTDMVETGILSSYANNKSVMTVASAQPDEVFFETAIKVGQNNVQYEDQIVNREGYDAEYTTEYKLADLPKKEGKVNWQYIPGFGTAADYQGYNVEGKVAVVNRGSTSFADKYATAKDQSAIGLIIINNDPTASDFSFRCSFGDDFMPTMPCALVLFKDKLKFSTQGSGDFSFITKEVSDNAEKRTMSTFSTDGAAFDLDLKPEITAPGDLIRGAVPPQKKEDKEETPLSTYQYLSGTSMSAPNYAGAQSLVYSKKAKDAYDNAGNITPAMEAELKEYRKTVDMRLMSTAVPMYDASVNPETGVKNYSSPRLQGAGMVNLEGAYNTEVYLKGRGLDGSVINKSKVCLGNGEQISKGNINLEFDAINEGDSAHSYNAKLTVMRPATKDTNEVISKDYNFRSEISDVKYLPGIKYYDADLKKMVSSYGYASFKDVFKLSVQLEYYPSEEAYEEKNPVIMAAGNWYVASQGQKQTSNVVYETLPNYTYQSTQDVVLFEDVIKTGVVANPGSTKISLSYELTPDMKAEILSLYEYGCMIEGFVTLISTDGEPNLNLPYLGFYSGSDVDNTKSYLSAPVVEPFEFEKDKTTIYPSDLVNDISKSLLGKDNVDFGSMWMVGYADNPENINSEKILTNDTNPKMLSGFHPIGTDPETGKYNENDTVNLYAGNPLKTNSMFIQQFVMRSVNDNYFTIKNITTGKQVYKSVLEDSLFGDQYGRYPLYKSHVDGSYLSAGYVAHRAFAKVPLYDTLTNETFADGLYELEFNYQLVGCGNQWVSKSYTFRIDSTEPEFKGVKQYVNDKGETMVRFQFSDYKLSYGAIGYQLINFEYDSGDQIYYIELTKAEVDEIIRDIGQSSFGESRIYLQAIDKAYGETGVVIHFSDGQDYSKYESLSGSNIKVNNDFHYDGTSVTTVSIDGSGNETEIIVQNGIYKNSEGKTFVVTTNQPTKSSGIQGWTVALIVVGSALTLCAVGVLTYEIAKKRKLNKEVNSHEK